MDKQEAKYDVIIIGAGTAGLSAAIYSARGGKRTLVIEGGMYGGQIVNSMEVENYPGIAHITGYEFASSLYNQAESLGVTMEWEQVTKVEHIERQDATFFNKVITDTKKFYGKNIIIATGVKKRSLGLEKEKTFIGHGISYCATCDGAFFKGKEVAVIGGGNTAIMDVIYLAKFCSMVYLIHRREEFRGEASKLQEIKALDNVKVMTPYVPVELLGEQQLEGIILEKRDDTKARTQLMVNGIFVAVGQQPANDIFKDLVQLDEHGYVMAGEDCRTNIKGIFAAGDCRTKVLRQLTTAAADGAVAATLAI